MVLRRIGPMSCAKISGALYAMLGLIFGAIFAVISLISSSFAAAASESGQPLIGALFGVGAVIFMPLFYGAIGFFGGLLTAALYNWMSRMVGGVEIELA